MHDAADRAVSADPDAGSIPGVGSGAQSGGRHDRGTAVDVFLPNQDEGVGKRRPKCEPCKCTRMPLTVYLYTDKPLTVYKYTDTQVTA